MATFKTEYNVVKVVWNHPMTRNIVFEIGCKVSIRERYFCFPDVHPQLKLERVGLHILINAFEA